MPIMGQKVFSLPSFELEVAGTSSIHTTVISECRPGGDVFLLSMLFRGCQRWVRLSVLTPLMICLSHMISRFLLESQFPESCDDGRISSSINEKRVSIPS